MYLYNNLMCTMNKKKKKLKTLERKIWKTKNWRKFCWFISMPNAFYVLTTNSLKNCWRLMLLLLLATLFLKYFLDCMLFIFFFIFMAELLKLVIHSHSNKTKYFFLLRILLLSMVCDPNFLSKIKRKIWDFVWKKE